MQVLPKCQLCNHYIANSKEGRRAHLQRYHGVTETGAHVRMDPHVKAKIVARVETRLKDFIVVSEPPMRNKCKGCGPTSAEGYWMTDGTGVCDSCLRKQTATIQVEEPPKWIG